MPTPEGDSHPQSNDDAGDFLRYPSETYQWHGCTQDCRELGVDASFAGSWGIRKIHAVTVFIKKKK